MAPLRVLTTVPGKEGYFWGDHTVLASGECARLIHGKSGFLSSHLRGVKIAAGMLRRMRDFDAAVVEGGRAGCWFAWLNALTPGIKKPVVMIDCLWARHPNPLLRPVKRWLTRLAARRVSAFVVWAPHEREDFAAEFGVYPEKFVFVPFHTTVEGYDFRIEDGGYVFAGGNSDRDYRVLIEAVRGTGIPTFIAATDRRLFAGIDLPANVTVEGVTPPQFREKLAACRIAVVPMRAGTLRSGGQQTFLNAMAMGKPTVVVGKRAAEGYIDHGADGFAVEFGDARELRRTIERLHADSALRKRIGEAAARSASRRTTEDCLREIYRLVESFCRPKEVPAHAPALDAGGFET